MRDYLRDIWRMRYFYLALVRKDLRNRYRHSVIGVGWTLLHPIAMTLVLGTVFSKMLKVDIQTYAPFLLVGLVTWSYITAVTNQGCICFFLAESYIRQHPAPLAIYPLRLVLGAGIHLLLGLSVVLIFTWYMRGFGNLPALIALIPALLLLFVIGWAVAICMGVINVKFPDWQQFVEIILQILFYATPIMYTTDKLRDHNLQWLAYCNPLAALLDLIRTPIIDGRFPPMETTLIATAATLIAVTAAILTLWRCERRLIFNL